TLLSLLLTHPHPTDIYTLSLHDALPIWNAEYQGEFEEARTLLAMPHSDFHIPHSGPMRIGRIGYINCYPVYGAIDRGLISPPGRSEEHTSELQSRFDLVCRLLLEKKKCR